MAHEDLTRFFSAPSADDNKYSRGVVGFMTGSSDFPGAAVLGATGTGDFADAEIALQQGPPAALDIAEAVRLAVRQLAA